MLHLLNQSAQRKATSLKMMMKTHHSGHLPVYKN